MKTFLALTELTKPRICLLALLMAGLGFFLGASDFNGELFVYSLIGIGLVGISSGALNQYLERDIDGLMHRTRHRPLPSGRCSPNHALILGSSAGIVGALLLLFAVNAVTAVLAAATLLFYLAVYTPSKRVTPLSTLVGAIPGAMPPLLGYTSSHGSMDLGGVLLFGILFLWQIPHFLAIAWIYQEDYARAKMPVLPLVDKNGTRTARQVVTYSLVLLPLSLVPAAWGWMGHFYFNGAMILGLLFLSVSLLWATYRSKALARRLFLASIIYLPALCFVMLWDRIF